MNGQVFFRRRIFRILFLTIFLIACGYVNSFSQGPDAKSDKPAPPVVNENYRIGPGDVIDVAVTNNATLTRTGIRVSDQGTIQLPMLEEDIVAACQTEKQLAAHVKEKYKLYLVSPYVTVSVREFHANPVAFLGAVQSPGRFQLQRPTRLLELLTLVNGPSPRAGRTIEIIRVLDRPYCDGAKLMTNVEVSEDLISYTLADTMKGVDVANPFVKAGDIIMVGEAEESVVYVQGSVKSSTAIPLKDPVTLTDAVAKAGGLASGASADKVRIRRSIPNSINRTELIVDFKAIQKGTRDDILLQANDIVEVPGPSATKKFFTDLVRGFLPSMASLPMQVIYW
jgi:polysaccharide export outer membrane protein